jgi:cytolysin-activating lysine-acyltransferase
MNGQNINENVSIKNESNVIDWLCPSLNDEEFNPIHIFGTISWLWTKSPMHQTWAIQSFSQYVWPAMMNRQFLLARDQKNGPMAYVSWAKFNAETEKKYLRNVNSIEPSDWNSGDRIWFIDWIAPFGGSRRVAKKIEYDIFPNDAGHSIRAKMNSKTGRIIDHYGANVSSEYKKRNSEQLIQTLNCIGRMNDLKA